MGKEQRLEIYDNAKGILILLVILGHTLLMVSAAELKPYLYFLKAIYGFHMAAFLMISGMLFNKARWEKESALAFIIDRFRHLIVPYLIFEAIGYSIQTIFNWGETDSVITAAKKVFSVQTYVGADWYLPTLFLAEIIVFVCLKYLNRILNCLLVLCSLVPFCFLREYESNQCLCFWLRNLICAAVIIVGFYYRDYFLAHYDRWLIALFGSLWVLTSQLNAIVFLHIPRLNNVFLFCICGLTGTLLIMGVSNAIHFPYLRILGRYSLVIMGTHQNIEYLIAYFYGIKPSFGYILCAFGVMVGFEIIIVYIYYHVKKSLGMHY